MTVNEQIRYAVGARYKLNDSLTVGGYVNYADLGEAQNTNDRFGGKINYNNALQLIVKLDRAI